MTRGRRHRQEGQPARLRRVLPFLALLLTIPAVAAPGDDGRLERGIRAEGRAAVAGVTADQGRLLALQRARASAIERASGAAADSFGPVTDGAMAADFLESYARGYIVSESVEWPAAKGEPAPAVPEYVVRITVDVKIPARKIAPMNLAARLGANAFRDGEKASLRVSASREARIAVFNFTADDRVTMLFPHPTDRSPVLAAGATVLLPPSESQYEWVLQAPAGHKEDIEAFYVVALDRSHDRDFCKTFDCGAPMSPADFFERYSGFAAWCEEVVLPYRVVAGE